MIYWFYFTASRRYLLDVCSEWALDYSSVRIQGTVNDKLYRLWSIPLNSDCNKRGQTSRFAVMTEIQTSCTFGANLRDHYCHLGCVTCLFSNTILESPDSLKVRFHSSISVCLVISSFSYTKIFLTLIKSAAYAFFFFFRITCFYSSKVAVSEIFHHCCKYCRFKLRIYILRTVGYEMPQEFYKWFFSVNRLKFNSFWCSKVLSLNDALSCIYKEYRGNAIDSIVAVLQNYNEFKGGRCFNHRFQKGDSDALI